MFIWLIMEPVIVNVTLAEGPSGDFAQQWLMRRFINGPKLLVNKLVYEPVKKPKRIFFVPIEANKKPVKIAQETFNTR